MSRVVINALATGVATCSVSFLSCLWLFPSEAGTGAFKDAVIATLVFLLCLTLAASSRSVT